jgi:hypothetical protein
MSDIENYKNNNYYVCSVCNYKNNKANSFKTHLNTKKHKLNVSVAKSTSSQQELQQTKAKELANKNLERLSQLAQQLQQSRITNNYTDDDTENQTNYDQETFDENFAKQFTNSNFTKSSNNIINERNMDIALNLSGPPIKPGTGFEVQLSKQIKEQMDKYHPNPNFEGVMPEEEVPYQKNHIWTVMFDSDNLELHPYQQESYEYFTDKYDFLPSKIRQAIFQDVKTLLAFNTLYNVPDYLA